jgi:hypothetical protein
MVVEEKFNAAKGQKGIINHFVPPGAKRYYETFYPARGQKVQ